MYRGTGVGVVCVRISIHPSMPSKAPDPPPSKKKDGKERETKITYKKARKKTMPNATATARMRTSSVLSFAATTFIVFFFVFGVV